MRDLHKIMEECIREMKAIHIPIRDHDILKIVADDIYDLGHIHDDGYWKNWVIQIRKDLLNDECPLVVLKEVIIHELIHTCPRCFSHGKTFVKYLKMMDEAYGYHLMVIKDQESIYHPDKPILRRYICPKCGAKYNERKPYPYGYHCIYCNVNLEEIKNDDMRGPL